MKFESFDFLKVFVNEGTPAQRAFALCLGCLIGITPLLSPHNAIVVILYMLFRVNNNVFVMGWGLSEVAALVLFPLFDVFGLWLLQLPSLSAFWTGAYNDPIWRFFRFNDSVVLGSFILSWVLIIPLFFVVWLTLKVYRERFLKGVQNLALIQKIQNSKLSFVTKILGVQHSSIKSPWFSKLKITLLSVIVVLSFGFYWLLSSNLIKDRLEKQLSALWQAPISISGVQFSVIPFAFELTGVSVADPDDVKRNQFEIQQLRLSISTYHYIVGRWVVEELTLKGMRFDQLRTVPYTPQNGAVAEPRRVKDMFKMPELAAPDIDQLISQSNLSFNQKIVDLQLKIDDLEKTYRNIQSVFLDDAQLKFIEQEIESLKGVDLNNPKALADAQKHWNSLKQKLTDQQKAITLSYEDLSAKQNVVNTDIRNLNGAIDQDINDLLSQYQLNNDGLGNLGKLILGPDVIERFDTAGEWYVKAEPIIEYAVTWFNEREQRKNESPSLVFKGTVVTFKEYDVQPSFNIKKTHISAIFKDKEWIGEGHNLHFDHQGSGMISELSFAEKSAVPLTVNGVFDYRVSGAGFSEWHFDQLDKPINQFTVLQEEKLPLIIDSGKEQVKGLLRIDANNQLQGQLAYNYKDISWDTYGYRTLAEGKYVVNALNNFNDFSIEINFGGSLGAPDIGFNSDLDAKLGDALKSIFKEFRSDFENEARRKLSDLRKSYIEDFNKKMIDLDNTSQLLNSKRSKIESLRRFDIQSLIEQNRLLEEQKRIEEAIEEQQNETEKQRKEQQNKAEKQRKEQQNKAEKQRKEQQNKTEKQRKEQQNKAEKQRNDAVENQLKKLF